MALTGHLVCSCMHTSDAADGVRRLMSVVSDFYRLNSCLIGVMAQRLVRAICPDCREEYEAESWAREAFSSGDDVRCFRGQGCDTCKGSGYRGRMAVQELIQMDDALRSIVVQGGTVEEIREQAVKSGMITMREDGLEKVKQGITTLEEVLRVT
jgi:type II secretory ATPase GspE/PulE/Tfp pilus assembly ATPase PilB-like protein